MLSLLGSPCEQYIVLIIRIYFTENVFFTHKCEGNETIEGHKFFLYMASILQKRNKLQLSNKF